MLWVDTLGEKTGGEVDHRFCFEFREGDLGNLCVDVIVVLVLWMIQSRRLAPGALNLFPVPRCLHLPRPSFEYTEIPGNGSTRNDVRELQSPYEYIQ